MTHPSEIEIRVGNIEIFVAESENIVSEESEDFLREYFLDTGGGALCARHRIANPARDDFGSHEEAGFFAAFSYHHNLRNGKQAGCAAGAALECRNPR